MMRFQVSQEGRRSELILGTEPNRGGVLWIGEDSPHNGETYDPLHSLGNVLRLYVASEPVTTDEAFRNAQALADACSAHRIASRWRLHEAPERRRAALAPPAQPISTLKLDLRDLHYSDALLAIADGAALARVSAELGWALARQKPVVWVTRGGLNERPVWCDHALVTVIECPEEGVPFSRVAKTIQHAVLSYP